MKTLYYSILGCSLIAPLTQPLQAVQVTAPGATGYTSDPGTGVPWDNVISFGGASGVYLGGGWVISAAHVGNPASVTIGATSHLIDPACSFTVGQAAGYSGTPDLRLHRLDTLPALSSLTLGGLSFGDNVDMIGYGGGTKRGGTNEIAGDGQAIQGNATGTLVTASAYTLDSWPNPSVTDEAQAVGGDSGGGVFVNNGGIWELGGIMFAVATDEDVLVSNRPRPNGTTITTDITFIADMDDYAPEIQLIIDTHGILTIPEPSSSLLILSALVIASTRRSRKLN